MRAKAGMKWKDMSSGSQRMGAQGGRTRDVSICKKRLVCFVACGVCGGADIVEAYGAQTPVEERD